MSTVRTAARLRGVTVDCPEPKRLAEFYHQLTGMPVAYSEDDFAGLDGGDLPGLNFQRVEGYCAPQWPAQDSPQQFHLDFGVDNLEKAEALALKLGATRPEFQPGYDRWRVLLDPAGHPFCLAAV